MYNNNLKCSTSTTDLIFFEQSYLGLFQLILLIVSLNFVFRTTAIGSRAHYVL